MMRSFLLLAAAAILSGCLRPRRLQPIETYDVQTRFSAPQPSREGRPLLPVFPIPVVAQFRVVGPAADTRMLLRSSAHHLEHDERHRWVQPPEKCIAREFQMAIRRRFAGVPRSGKGEARLYGDILAMEVTAARSAHLAMELRLVDDLQGYARLRKLYERVEPIEKPEPAAFADAMSAALESIIEEALRDMAKVLEEQ